MCVEKQLIGEHLHEVLDKGTQIDRQIHRYIDGQIDRQTDRQIDRQTDRQLHRYFFNYYDLGFESLLEASRYSDLSLLYQLFSRFKDGVPLIRKGFGEYIKV